MKNQSDVHFTLQILRLRKIENKDLTEKQQKFFQKNIEQSIEKYLENKKSQNEYSNKFELIMKELDTEGEIVRLILDASTQEVEYYQQMPVMNFGNVYMGEYLVILIDINRTEGYQLQEIVGLEFGLEITNEGIKKKCFGSEIKLANKANVKLVLKLKIEDMAKHLFDCHLRQLVRDYRHEQTSDANGLLSTVAIPIVNQADKIFKFRVTKKMPFTFEQVLYLHRPLKPNLNNNNNNINNNNNNINNNNNNINNINVVTKVETSVTKSGPIFYCQLHLNNSSNDNTVYFKKIDFKVSERNIFSSTLINA